MARCWFSGRARRRSAPSTPSARRGRRAAGAPAAASAPAAPGSAPRCRPPRPWRCRRGGRRGAPRCRRRLSCRAAPAARCARRRAAHHLEGDVAAERQADQREARAARPQAAPRPSPASESCSRKTMTRQSKAAASVSTCAAKRRSSHRCAQAKTRDGRVAIARAQIAPSRRSARSPRGRSRARRASRRCARRAPAPRPCAASNASARPAAAARESGPTGVATSTQRCARLQLRVRPDVAHVVDVRVGDLRLRRGARRPARRVSVANASTMIARSASRACGARARSRRSAGRRRASGCSQHLRAERLPLALVLQAEHHRLAVAGRETGRRDRWSRAPRRRAAAARRRRRRSTADSSSTRPCSRASTRRCAQPLPVRPRCDQRGEDVAVGVHAGGDVGDRAAGLGRLVGRAGDRQEAGLALDQQVVGLLVAVGSGRSGRRRSRRCRRRSGADAASCSASKRQAQARRRAGREVLHQHVGAARAARSSDSPAPAACLRSSVRLSLERLVQTKCEARPLHALVVGAREVAARRAARP